eukprot:7849375-Pyramimonas_sp.AAC.1
MADRAGAVEELVFKAQSQRFSFFVLGDWGMGTQQQRDVADAMKEEAKAMDDPLFVLNVGDNFYHNGHDSDGNKMGGVFNLEDPLWKEYFEDVYTGHHLEKLPFVSIFGNHDYMGNLSAQMHGCVLPLLYIHYTRATRESHEDRSKNRSPRFLIPDRNYVSR